MKDCRSVALFLVAIAMAACTNGTGPAYRAYSVDTGDGVKTYRAECHGLFENHNACQRAAERICKDQQVHVLNRTELAKNDSAASDANAADPREITFRCGT